MPSRRSSLRYYGERVLEKEAPFPFSGKRLCKIAVLELARYSPKGWDEVRT